MCLSLFGATEMKLRQTDMCMSAGQISIQRQRSFAFGYTLARAVTLNLEVAQAQMGKGMFGSEGQHLGQNRFGRRELCRLMLGRIKARLLYIYICLEHQRPDFARCVDPSCRGTRLRREWCTHASGRRDIAGAGDIA